MLSVGAGDHEIVDSARDVDPAIVMLGTTLVSTLSLPQTVQLLSVSSAELLSLRDLREDLYTVAGAYPGQIYSQSWHVRHEGNTWFVR